MSLRIDTDAVTEVLIAGTWYTVADKSFDLDSYEFIWDGRCIHGGGNSGVCATGYSFKIKGRAIRMSGPLTAVQGVRYGVGPVKP